MKKIFKNKKVLITGHTGFKGSWLTIWMSILGARVIGLSLEEPSKPSHYKLIKFKKKIINLRSDIKNLENTKKIFKKFQPDFVFHFAAQSLVRKSYLEPVNTFLTNSIGTLNVLEALKQVKKNCVAILITSDKSYRNFELKRGYKEDDILGGDDPYSSSKAAAELIIRTYLNIYTKNNFKNLKIGVARAGNVVGGGDWSENRLVPDCIKAWSSNRPVIIRNPYSTRPWQHVLEALWGYIIFSAKLKKKNNLNGQIFNFGPKNNQNKSVLALLKEAKNNWLIAQWKIIKEKKIKESKLLKLNSNKAKKKLNWECVLSFSETIQMIFDWYKKYYSLKKNSNMYEYSKKQVLEYMKRVNKLNKKI